MCVAGGGGGGGVGESRTRTILSCFFFLFSVTATRPMRSGLKKKKTFYLERELTYMS